jgi:hypothetical protein
LPFRPSPPIRRARKPGSRFPTSLCISIATAIAAPPIAFRPPPACRSSPPRF